jgi:glycosyltransferase involved in cell wall biosynthesis
MNNSLVTVICLCYNHAPYVKEALESVASQSWAKNIELIVVDDASEDNSVLKIEEVLKVIEGKLHSVLFFKNLENYGNCRAFNKAFAISNGQYLVDLAADDILLPERVEEGVEALGNAPERTGVHFCDVELIDEHGNFLKNHFPRNADGEIAIKIPQGDIFKNLLARYIICAPSMMMKREVLGHLGGYDETLAYEDFDFWVRSSRKFHYIFSDKVLVKKREIKNSLGKRQYKKGNLQLISTYKVCEKAYSLVENEEEKHALLQRVQYEFRQAFLGGKYKEVELFAGLLKRLKGLGIGYYFLRKANEILLKLSQSNV